MNKKELLYRKVIVYSLLSALVVLAGNHAREMSYAGDDKKK
ncbi:hypothetical protein [Paenibacillus faecalis]|nr:hypothetical protein [Paenibacillus faecalis]